MNKKKQKRSKVKEFLRGINGVNIMKGSNHYAAYCKVPFKRNYIHNIKELPCSKNTIKLALKRLIISLYQLKIFFISLQVFHLRKRVKIILNLKKISGLKLVIQKKSIITKLTLLKF